MVVTMVACYLLCWLPYGIAALLSTFSPRDLLTPEVTIVPSLLAKTSTVINPVIYIYMNSQFYRCFKALLRCSIPDRSSSLKASSPATKTLGTIRNGNGHDVPGRVCKVGLYRNGRAVSLTLDQFLTSDLDQSSRGAVLNLSSGDQVWLQVYGAAQEDVGIYADIKNDSTFTGFLTQPRLPGTPLNNRRR
ncbi:hypothetical protein J4Q44_G00296450 [Coregonus suidteri]|uniref:G-protein coupled receptors family 1 profile domain-containing protein n=1 Tax=Coregonus suidteri TaxID=861788 RepID=A0AAN8KVJ0_9TELE